jgi:thioredoxin reductase
MHMAKSSQARLAVLGAGPIGLEAALYARALGYSVTLFERGQVGEALRHWGHVRLFSPFAMNQTPLGRQAIAESVPDHVFPGDDDCITGWQHRQAYLEPLAACGRLAESLRLGTDVVAVGRTGMLKHDWPGDPRRGQQPFRLLVRDNKQRESIQEADIILDCTGTYGRPRWLGAGGIPAAGERQAYNLISYGAEDVAGSRKQVYAGKGVLVVGGGYSAATTVAGLAGLVEHHPEMWITWLVRAAGTQPLKRIPNDPFKERDRLAARANNLATRTDANVEFHAQAAVEAVEMLGEHNVRVTANVAGKSRSWEVDRVIANVGYTPDTDLYRELQVQESCMTLGTLALAEALAKQKKNDGSAGLSGGPESLRNLEPNFFVLGAKSYGRNSQFLLRDGFAQVRDVFRLITGKSELDLYKKG